ncbi:MAG: MBL fold metallo-hydrolase [Chloroflexi bacterium]|nr:MBL fold metallo-hydrolase [Chloroflexota bacterium]
MHVQMLGTGSPKPRVTRAGASAVILMDDAGLLFDCGPGTTIRLVQADIPSRRITHLFFSHLHFDHCTDYPFFGLSRWDQAAGSAQPLQVFGPPGVEVFHQRLFGPEGVFASDIAARRFNPASQAVWVERGGILPRPEPEIVVRDVPVGIVAKGRDWVVRAAVATHTQPHLESYSYRIDGPGRSVVYTGDTGYCQSLVDLARGADTLIHMCAFPDEELKATGVAGVEEMCSSPAIAARVAAEAGVRELVLTHLQSDRLQSQEGQGAMVAVVQQRFRGAVRVAADLMVV